MDYAEIGQRIRRIRKQRGWSQEILAEKINISTTHMSHIETGSTKLSLPVLVDIARALEVGADTLLCTHVVNADTLLEDFRAILNQCSTKQARVLLDMIRAAKKSMDKNL